MRIAVLGHLDAWNEGPPESLAPKPRKVLAMLVVNANRVTSVHEIATELWGEDLPASYQTTLQTYVYQIRRILDGPGVAIITRPRGYLLQIPEESVDVWQAGRGLAEARSLLRSPSDDAGVARACALLDDVLALWRGPVLADVDCGEVLAGYVARFEEMRIDALELSIDARLRGGRHRELVGELKQLVRRHPFHEKFHAQLVLALAASGRRQEAVTVFLEVSSTLRRTLGVDPSPCLEQAFRTVLGADEKPSAVRSGREPSIERRPARIPAPGYRAG